MQMTITTQGLDQLRARYRRAPQIIREEFTKSMTRVVIEGERLSKQLAPKWRNHLARSITHKVTPMSGAVRGEGGPTLSYAKYQELGTRRHFVPAKYIGAWAQAHGFGYRGLIVSGKKQPFIKPAFQRIRPKITTEFTAAMRRVVARLRAG
jgi:HK97 gp10 family phage protein